MPHPTFVDKYPCVTSKIKSPSLRGILPYRLLEAILDSIANANPDYVLQPCHHFGPRGGGVTDSLSLGTTFENYMSSFLATYRP